METKVKREKKRKKKERKKNRDLKSQTTETNYIRKCFDVSLEQFS